MSEQMRQAAKRARLRAGWRELMAEWEASGMTQAAFCREKGLGVHRFLYWRRKFGADGPVSSRSCRSGDPATPTEQGFLGAAAFVELSTACEDGSARPFSARPDSAVPEPIAAVAFAEVVPPAGFCPPGAGGPLVVRVRDRFAIEVPNGFSPRLLGQVIQVLEGL